MDSEWPTQQPDETGPFLDYNEKHAELEDVLKSIDRPGDYFVEGRLESLPPRMRVASVGKIAFPILEAQVAALIAAAEQAPYGRGPDTVLDRSVRDCWQIEAGNVDLSGPPWEASLASILDRLANGLGLPRGGISVRLYKLLIYEPGGFFAEHRDTEKAAGMVATLVVSLPVEGEGGELVIRHGNREATLDLCVDDLGEIAYAGFYADCVHRTEPVRRGHRISLVFNVTVKSGVDGVPTGAPDLSSQIDEAVRLLANWPRGEDAPNKVVWLLDHQYSEEGLSFDSLKGIDAPVGRALAAAAERADCVLCLAVLQIREHGTPHYAYVSYEGRPDKIDYSGKTCPISEFYEGAYTLTGWVPSDGSADPGLGQMPLEEGEALPAEALAGVAPDRQTLLEATGNEGVSLSRSYRRAALAIWPRSESVRVIARGRIEGAVNFVLRELESYTDSEAAHARGVDLVTQLIDVWPQGHPRMRSKQFMQETGLGVLRTLQLLVRIDEEAQTARFLRRVVPLHYHEQLNQALVPALEIVSPDALRLFFRELVRINLVVRPGGVFNLLVCLGNSPRSRDDTDRREILQTSASSAVQNLIRNLEPDQKRSIGWNSTLPAGRVLDEFAIRDLFLACATLDIEDSADRAAALLRRHQRSADPYRTIPRALTHIRSYSQALVDLPAIMILWRHAARQLLGRSAFPPPGPDDKSIDAPIRCPCKHCRDLAAFCVDQKATVIRFRENGPVRAHLEREIRTAHLDIACETVARGSPYTLVCSKTPAGYEQRMAWYRADVEAMEMLVEAAPGVGRADIPLTLEKLRLAIDLSG